MADENNEKPPIILRIKEGYTGFDFESPLIKILDRNIDLTENQFVDYFTRKIKRNLGIYDDEMAIYSTETRDEGDLLYFSFELVKSLSNYCLDNRYYLFAGNFDRFDQIINDDQIEQIGYLKIYNIGSKPPRFVLLVNQSYSEYIKRALDEMLTELNLQEPAGQDPPANDTAVQDEEDLEQNRKPTYEEYVSTHYGKPTLDCLEIYFTGQLNGRFFKKYTVEGIVAYGVEHGGVQYRSEWYALLSDLRQHGYGDKIPPRKNPKNIKT